MKSQLNFIDFISRNKTASWIFAFAAFLIIFLFSSILGWPTSYLFGFLAAGLLAYFLFNFPLQALFSLILIRMFLDYPSEAFSIKLLNLVELSYSQALGLVIALAGILYLIKNYHRLLSIPLKIPIIALFAFSGITLFYSVDFLSTSKEVLRIFDLIFLFIFSYIEINTKKSYRLLLRIILISALLSSVIGISQFLLGIGYTDAAFAVPRIFGTFSHPNSFSLYLISVLAALFIYSTLNKSQNKKIIFSLLFAIFVLSILLTYTRVAWITILLFLGALGLAKFRKLLVSLLIFAVAVYIFVPSIQERINEGIYQSPSNSVSFRKTLWKDSVNEVMVNRRQVLGYGSNTFETVMQNKKGSKRGSVAAHNDFIRSFLEGGFLGLGIFIFYLMYILIYLLAKYRKLEGNENKMIFLVLLALFFSMTLAGLTDNIMRNTPLQWIFWILLGASLRVFGNDKKGGHAK